MSARCLATRVARTPGTAETALTAAVTGTERICRSIRSPSALTRWSSGSVVISSRTLLATSTIASGSFRSTSASSTAQVTARYMAPVSR